MIDTNKYEGHTEGPWHFCLGYDIESDTYTGINPLKGGGDRVNGPVILSNYQFAKGTYGQRVDAQLIEDSPLLLAEVKRLRKIIYKCWKDSDHSLYYLQVKLLNDQEHWYQEMMCEDGSCEDDDCECGKGRPWDYTTTEDPWDAEFDKEVE